MSELPVELQLPVQLRHVRQALPRLLMLHTTFSLLIMLQHGSISENLEVSMGSLQRQNEAAQRALALGECWDQLHGLNNAPVQYVFERLSKMDDEHSLDRLQHCFFIATKVIANRLDRLDPSHHALRLQLEANQVQLITFVEKMGTTWASAMDAAAMLRTLVTKAVQL